MPSPVNRPRPRLLRVLLGGAVGLVLLCAGLLSWLLAMIHPEPAEPGLRHASRGSARETLPRSALPLEPEGHCLLITNVRAESGVVAEAEMSVGQGYLAPSEPILTDAAGRASSLVPCGLVYVTVEAEGFAPWRDIVQVPAGRPFDLDVLLVPGRLVQGTVSDPDGAPIAEALVSSGAASAETEADGAYTLVMPLVASALEVTALGYDDAVVPVPAAEETAPTRVDITLQPNHDVAVYCLGMTDDVCPDMPLFCTSPWLLIGEECDRRGPSADGARQTICPCPDGEVAVRGGGASVLVREDEHEAWLDLSLAGSVRGRVVSGSQRVTRCSVELIRIPEALEDLPRGLLVAQRVDCDHTGAFLAEGVVAGDWELHLEANATEESGKKERTLPPLHVGPGARVDVGALDVQGGGVVAGLLIDGLTGQPLSHEPVVCVRWSDGPERSAVLGGQSDQDGHFRIEGMPPGTWSLSHILSPQDAVEVEVRDGELTDGIRIETSEATSLDINGFTLTEEEGQLVVAEVEEGSPADDAGLEAGEVVVGVRLAGIDLGSSIGSKGAEISRFVLGHWDGPGVSLVVKGPSGEEELVPLDW